MKIQYASDLHLEFRENSELIEQHPLKVAGDILILAGDTNVFRGKSWEKHPFFDWCAEHYKETYLVPGNHEYYNGIELTEHFDDYEYMLRDNVRYINNRSILIDETELFFTTLWSIIPPSEIVPIQLGVSDCHRIKYNGRAFTAHDYARLHEVCVNWLSEALKKSNSKHKIVVTHHQPTTRIRDPRFMDSPIDSAFVIQMDDFIESRDIDYWIYGHTHYNGGSNIKIGNTLMLTNQMGYVSHGEHQTFLLSVSISQ